MIMPKSFPLAQATLNSTPVCDKRLWAEAVQTSVYLKKTDNLIRRSRVRLPMRHFAAENLRSSTFSLLVENVIFISLRENDLWD
jgi:hypothetical protein